MKKHFDFRFSETSEASSSEAQEYPEDMFPRYYIHSDVFR